MSRWLEVPIRISSSLPQDEEFDEDIEPQRTVVKEILYVNLDLVTSFFESWCDTEHVPTTRIYAGGDATIGYMSIEDFKKYIFKQTDVIISHKEKA